MQDRISRASRRWYELDEGVRYLVVGGFNTLVGYLLFLFFLATIGAPLSDLGGSPITTMAAIGRNYYIVVQWIGWVVAVVFSTTTMKYFAFRNTGTLWPQIGRAYFVYLPAQGLSSVILWLAVRVAHLSPQVGALAAIAVTTIFSYFGHKYFTFARGSTDV